MVARAKKAIAGSVAASLSGVVDGRGRDIWPDVAIPPGEHLEEILEAKEMSQSELARQMGRPVQAVNEIVRGVKAITPETALQLERVLGISGAVWVRLEANYQYNRARLSSLRTERRRDLERARPSPFMARRMARKK